MLASGVGVAISEKGNRIAKECCSPYTIGGTRLCREGTGKAMDPDSGVSHDEIKLPSEGVSITFGHSTDGRHGCTHCGRGPPDVDKLTVKPMKRESDVSSHKEFIWTKTEGTNAIHEGSTFKT